MSYQWFCSKRNFSSSYFVIMFSLRRNQRLPARLQPPRVRDHRRHHHRHRHRHRHRHLRLRIRIRQHLRRSRHSKTTLPSFLNLIWNLIIRRNNMRMRIPSKHPWQWRLIVQMILFEVRRQFNIFKCLRYFSLNHRLRNHDVKKYGGEFRWTFYVKNPVYEAFCFDITIINVNLVWEFLIIF